MYALLWSSCFRVLAQWMSARGRLTPPALRPPEQSQQPLQSLSWLPVQSSQHDGDFPGMKPAWLILKGTLRWFSQGLLWLSSWNAGQKNPLLQLVSTAARPQLMSQHEIQHALPMKPALFHVGQAGEQAVRIFVSA